MMRIIPLLACIPFLLSGCLEVDYVRHDMEVSLKDGVLCFSPLSDDRVRKEQINISGIDLSKANVPIMNSTIWEKSWDVNQHLSLSGDKCLPYGGDAPLGKNTLYVFSFFVRVTDQKQEEEHLYGAFFCLSDKKNGETVIQQFSENYPKIDGAPEPPTTCPPLPEDAPAANPGEGASTP
jgi:hypothetical protein